MTTQFIWNDSLSVGRDDIDGQHRQILEMANSMPEQMRLSDWKRAVMKLYRYTRDHFAAEEQMMKELGYPQLSTHRALHDELIDRLNAHSNAPKDEQVVTEAFKSFISDWVWEHVMEQDMDFFRFVQNGNH